VLVEDARILHVSGYPARPSDIPAGFVVHDFGNDCLLPGLVDTHVHINEPGRTEWEGFVTATNAAAAGGCTTLIDMPLNCLPETATVAALQEKRAAAAGKCRVDWAAWGGVTSDNQQHIEALADNGVRGFKCFLIYPGIEGFTMVNERELRAALPHVARAGLPLLVHAELPGPLDRAAAGLTDADWRRYPTYLASRPDDAETSAIELMIGLCREFGCRVHIVHLATANGVPLLAAARAEGLPITVETCPHYLHFSAEEIADGATLFKCAPPIRGRNNRELLWQGLLDGVIDCVVTDHSPCPAAMKQLEEGNFQNSWGGIASLSVALPVMWTELRARGIPLKRLAEWMSSKPAALAGLHRKGAIAEGFDADLVVFDTEAEFIVSAQHLHFRHGISPYLGEKLHGVVKATYLRGNLIYSSGRVVGEPLGAEIRS
jgi:allantoinase